MRDSNFINDTFDRIARHLPDKTCGQEKCLLEPAQVILLAYTAKGIIDNGGFQFFYEGASHAIDVAWAFDELGFTQAADACRQSTAVFTHGIPPADHEERNALMDKLGDQTARCWEPLNNLFYDTTKGFDERLAQYIRTHQATLERYLKD
jgi:hypothetical protein